jgi:hypothetical protein
MSLTLPYLAVDRLTVAEHVYVEVARPKREVTA